MMNIFVRNVRRKQRLALSLQDSFMCTIEIRYEKDAISYDSVRLDHFLSEVLSIYTAVSLSDEPTKLYLDGYEAYLTFEGRSPISVTLSDDEISSNVAHLDYEDLRKGARELLDQMRIGLSQLNLSKKELLEIRHSFRYGGMLISASDVE